MQHQHYQGRIAEWYDEFVGTSGNDIDFYTDHFKGFTGTVLELACGTGRVLLPIAQSSVKIDGLDSSMEMLDILKSKAHRLGIEGIELFHQSMDAFKLTTTYDAIYISSGSFQLLTAPEQAINGLQCIRQHLSDGGFLLIDLFIPWAEIRLQKLRSYAVTRDVVRADGWRSVVMERFEIDIPQQIKQGVYRYDFYDGNRLVESLIDELSIRWYWKEEFLLLLQTAAFSNVQILEDKPLYTAGEGFVFKAWK